MLYPVRPEDDVEDGRVGDASGDGAGEAEQQDDDKQDDEGVIEEAVVCKPERPACPHRGRTGGARGHPPTV